MGVVDQGISLVPDGSNRIDTITVINNSTIGKGSIDIGMNWLPSSLEQGNEALSIAITLTKLDS